MGAESDRRGLVRAGTLPYAPASMRRLRTLDNRWLLRVAGAVLLGLLAIAPLAALVTFWEKTQQSSGGPLLVSVLLRLSGILMLGGVGGGAVGVAFLVLLRPEAIGAGEIPAPLSALCPSCGHLGERGESDACPRCGLVRERTAWAESPGHGYVEAWAAIVFFGAALFGAFMLVSALTHPLGRDRVAPMLFGAFLPLIGGLAGSAWFVGAFATARGRMGHHGTKLRRRPASGLLSALEADARCDDRGELTFAEGTSRWHLRVEAEPGQEELPEARARVLRSLARLEARDLIDVAATKTISWSRALAARAEDAISYRDGGADEGWRYEEAKAVRVLRRATCVGRTEAERAVLGLGVGGGDGDDLPQLLARLESDPAALDALAAIEIAGEDEAGIPRRIAELQMLSALR